MSLIWRGGKSLGCYLSSGCSLLQRKTIPQPSTSWLYGYIPRANESSAVTQASQEEGEPDKLYQRIEIEVRGHDPAVLKSYEWFACTAANHLGITVANTWVPPRHTLRRNALKSVFIYKKHIVQYEVRTYFRALELKHLTGSTADTYLEYIQRNLPEGVAMKVTKEALEKMPEHIKLPDSVH